MTSTAEMYDSWLERFTTHTLDVEGVATAVYSAPASSKPNVLFVHGINGDFHGLVPLAYELRNDCRVIFVDMPGHGATATPRVQSNLDLVRQWSRSLPAVLRTNGLAVERAVGHSFGAFVVQETKLGIVALLNPPFATSKLSNLGTVLINAVTPVVRGLYSSYPMMVSRGHWLMHARNEAIDAIIAWSSGHTRVSRQQFYFQSHFATEIVGKELIDMSYLKTIPQLLVVLARYDRIVDNTAVDLSELDHATIATLDTDHVSVFETPAQVAEEIRHATLAAS